MDRLGSIRVFRRVAEEGSFAAAARGMDLSPAAVTRQVADLEAELGTRLFHRTTRRVSLTQAGETFLERVRDILDDIDDAFAQASSSTTDLAGVLRIHAPPVLATHMVAPLLTSFRALHPAIRFELDVDSSLEPPVDAYDLTLLAATSRVSADTIVRTVIESESVLVATPEYLRRRGTPTEPAQLVSHDLLRLSPSDARRRPWQLLLPDPDAPTTEVPVEPVMWANHTDTLLRAALDGAGITSAPADLVAEDLIAGRLVRVLAPWLTGRLAVQVALPSRRFMPRRTQVFLDYLIERSRKQSQSVLQACMAC